MNKDYIQLLHDAVMALPKIMQSTSQKWNSLHVDYHKPYVDRVWTLWNPPNQTDEFRIFLHKIYPCTAEESLFHP